MTDGHGSSQLGSSGGDGAATDVGTTPPGDPRMQPAAANPGRAEMVIALAFLVGLGCVAAFGGVYWVGGQTQAEGVLLGVGLGAIGFGMTAWGKYLMPRGPFAEDRHTLTSDAEQREAFGAALERGTEQVRRRGFLGVLMAGAMGVFGIVAAFPLIRSLGPVPGTTLQTTAWRRNSRIVTRGGKPVHVDDLQVGGVLTVFPADDIGGAYSQTLLLRASSTPIVTKPGRETWSPAGYLAYSKVCTHAGCPVALYEEQYQQLLCPCHQSLFNVLDGAVPVFGPAPRALPQLPLMLDRRGFLRAQRGYDEAVGPGFWERSS